MLCRIPTLLAVLGATVATGAIAFTRTPVNHRYRVVSKSSSAADESPVGSLNRCIQDRFHNLKQFGMSRLSIVHEYVHRFNPETPDEKAAVVELQRDGIDVAFYLGGRDLLAKDVIEADRNPAGPERADRTMSAAVFVTDRAVQWDLPNQSQLREHGRKALVASTASDVYTSSIERWSIEARPVRADRQACLKCHAEQQAADAHADSLRIGDALGVLIYVYAQAPK